MKREGYRESTIRSTVAALKAIAKRSNLLEPEQVKAYLSRAPMGEGRKETVADYLKRFYEFLGVRFEKPRYRRIDKLPFIPLESEIDALIAGVGKKTAAFLQLIKETGMRPGEAWRLKWIDLDLQNNTITITPEKHSRARRYQISNRLVAMLNALPRKWEVHLS